MSSNTSTALRHPPLSTLFPYTTLFRSLPKYAAKKWHQFFKRIGLPHLSFHCTRVTVVTRLARKGFTMTQTKAYVRSEEHTSELQSRFDLVCRLLLEKKNPACRRSASGT